RQIAVPLRLSLVIAPWALLLLFFFLRHLGEYSAIVGQISGVVIAAVYVWYYENLNDLAVRFLVIGADRSTISCLLIIALLGMFRVAWRPQSNAAAQRQALDKSA